MSEITIMMDQAWLMDEVSVPSCYDDPTVRIEKNRQPLMMHLCVRDPSSSYGYNFSELEVGRNRPYQVCRTFLKFNTPSTTGKGSGITGARLNLYIGISFQQIMDRTFRVSAHEVTGSWISVLDMEQSAFLLRRRH